MGSGGTRYARSGNVHIAYRVHGDAPRDLVFVPPFVSNVELWWDEPILVRLFERLASFTRLIILDKRGTGLSDRTGGMATLEERMDDVRAVMDAVGSERAAVWGASEGAAMAVLFAATHPERTSALALLGGIARWTATPDYPWALTAEMYDEIVAFAAASWVREPPCRCCVRAPPRTPAFRNGGPGGNASGRARAVWPSSLA